MTTLQIECGWCHKPMGEKDGKGTTGITSGMCEECWNEMFPDIPYPTEEDIEPSGVEASPEGIT